jgi:hypothetical protein
MAKIPLIGLTGLTGLDKTICEAIITLVMQETYDDVTYPVTRVYRIEFEGPDEALSFAYEAGKAPGIVAYELLVGAEEGKPTTTE